MLLSAEEIEEQLKKLNMIIPVRYYDAIGSTNSAAKLVHDETDKHYLVVAGRQTQGRGRNGRSFQSEFGGGYFSFTFSLGAEDVTTQLCGSVMLAVLAVRSVMEEYGVDCSIKWPNDVLCGGRKLCGILSEVVYDRDFPDYMVIGIGINVNNPLTGIEDIATSTLIETGRKLPVAEVVARIVRRFFEMLSDKDFEVMTEYRKCCATLGKNVRVTSPDEEFYGVAEDLDEKGMLVVRTQSGQRRVVSCGDVSIRDVLS